MVVLAAVAKFQRLFDQSTKDRHCTILQLQVKLDRGRVEYARISENEELRPDLLQP